jgi:hypothetical protein
MRATVLVGAAISMACYVGDGMDPANTAGLDDGSDAESSGIATSAADDAADSSDEAGEGDETGGPVGDGLPCDIDAFLQMRCRSCHSGNPMVSGTLLLTHDDLLAASISEPGVSVGIVASHRLADGAPMPMPPAPAAAVATAERDAFSAWVEAGMPAGDCTAEPDPFDVDPVCSSDVYWTGGDEESSLMHPGRTCISCHSMPDPEDGEAEDYGPLLVLAGTVYPTAHEPDDCNGIDGPALAETWVEVQSDNGDTVQLSVNAAGNFLIDEDDIETGFPPPYRVKVVSAGVERAMADPAPHGDCNACHTQDGTQDAPGRILLP